MPLIHIAVRVPGDILEHAANLDQVMPRISFRVVFSGRATGGRLWCWF
jgi:hypothetical protein